MPGARGGRAAARAFRASATWRGEPALSVDATSSRDAGAGGGSLAGVLRLRKTRQVPPRRPCGDPAARERRHRCAPVAFPAGLHGDVVGPRWAEPSGSPAPSPWTNGHSPSRGAHQRSLSRDGGRAHLSCPYSAQLVSPAAAAARTLEGP